MIKIVEDCADHIGVTDAQVFFIIAHCVVEHEVKNKKQVDKLSQQIAWMWYVEYRKTRELPEVVTDLCLDLITDRIKVEKCGKSSGRTKKR